MDALRSNRTRTQGVTPGTKNGGLKNRPPLRFKLSYRSLAVSQ